LPLCRTTPAALYHRRKPLQLPDQRLNTVLQVLAAAQAGEARALAERDALLAERGTLLKRISRLENEKARLIAALPQHGADDENKD